MRERKSVCLGAALAVGSVAFGSIGIANADTRTSTSKKGSVLVFPSVEVKWDAAGDVTQDTYLSVINDYPDDVFIHFLFVNGDDDIPAEVCCNPPMVVERAHNGWTKQNYTAEWTHDEPTYFSVLTGLPKGAPPITNLDNGLEGPGRPDEEAPAGGRVLRGFVLAWAVDAFGDLISWNHLSGSATVIHYADMAAWEYNAYAFQALITQEGTALGTEGGSALQLDGVMYDSNYDKLLLDFFASGSTPFSQGGKSVMVETDLTLLPMIQDLRQNNDGPVHTKAQFDVWNQNEDFLSHSDHCLFCWDQFLLSDVALPNQFLVGNLQTDKGKARINGVASPTVCDDVNCCDRGDLECIENYEFEWHVEPPICSQSAPFVGVANKILAFSGTAVGTAYTGMTLVGQGTESGYIYADTPDAPEQATGGTKPVRTGEFGDSIRSNGGSR